MNADTESESNSSSLSFAKTVSLLDRLCALLQKRIIKRIIEDYFWKLENRIMGRKKGISGAHSLFSTHCLLGACCLLDKICLDLR